MHNHSVINYKTSSRKIKIAIYLNILIVVVQGSVGLIIDSLSLLSDALHNFSDVLSLVVSMIAIRLVARIGSLKKTFGFKRAEIIAAMLNGLLLILLSLLLIKEAFFRVLYPIEIESTWIIILASVSFFINIGCTLLLSKEAAYNLNIRSSYVHMLSDAMTSLAIVVGGFFMYYKGAYWVDGLLTFMISLYLLYLGWKIVKETFSFIMHFVPSHLDIKEIEEEVLKIDHVKNMHHVHLWQLNENQIHFEAHIDFQEDLNLSEVTLILSKIDSLLLNQFKINHVTLQPEIGVNDSKNLVSGREC